MTTNQTKQNKQKCNTTNTRQNTHTQIRNVCKKQTKPNIACKRARTHAKQKEHAQKKKNII